MSFEQYKFRIKKMSDNLQKLKNEDKQNGTAFTDSYVAIIEKEYLGQIKELINQLNVCHGKDDLRRAEIIAQIKEVDKLFLAAQEKNIINQILFTRHGQCDFWGQKRFGLNPNSPLAEEALEHLEETNQYTQSLLTFTDKSPRIAISPMTRAMQTAGLIIPKQLSSAEISIEPVLSENSSAPSGHDVRSVKDMQLLSKEYTFWKSPLKAILFFLSSLIYGHKVFEEHKQKRQEAIKNIQLHNGGVSIITSEGDVKQDLHLDKEKKIERIQQFIHDVDEGRDLWLIGHGKNFTDFFERIFNINTDFDFGDTQPVYKIAQSENKSYLFVTPYTLIVNQDTGKLEGKYKGVIGQVEEQTLNIEHSMPCEDEGAQLISSCSYSAMKQRGIDFIHPDRKSSFSEHTIQPTVGSMALTHSGPTLKIDDFDSTTELNKHENELHKS